MNNPKCPSCGGEMKRNGKTSAGSQRWRRTACDASTTQIYVHDYERRQHPAEEFIEEFLEE